ncbi:MAG: hypothetical protein H6918_01295 [Sphingomonadaceae bacterium]|nr:hypothetical protein [Sphingomonadaceae bacterium]
MSSLPFAAFGERQGFAPDARFSRVSREPVLEPVDEQDPVEIAYEQGLAEGRAAAEAEAQAILAAHEAQWAQLQVSLAQLDAEALEGLREKLRLTVLALCEEAVLPLALDPDGLTARIEAALGMLQRAQDERRLRLHPDDLELLRDRLPQGLAVEADPSLERGALRIETEDGGVEDGPGQWRRILAEAFDAC